VHLTDSSASCGGSLAGRAVVKFLGIEALPQDMCSRKFSMQYSSIGDEEAIDSVVATNDVNSQKLLDDHCGLASAFLSFTSVMSGRDADL
jgi:hypothetical protein